MFCQKCGFQVEDEVKICPNCGCPTVTEDSTVKKKKIPTSKVLPLIPNAIGVISGILCFVFAIISKVTGNASPWFTESYGGDAYTGIQNAATATANNVNELCSIVSSVACMLFIVLGLTLIAFFGGKLVKALKK